MTVILIAINLLVFFVQVMIVNENEFIMKYSLVPARLVLTDISTWYPLITSMFLHGGVMHILGNMWFLWIFGDNVEEDLGVFFYLLLYLIGGIVGDLLQLPFMINSSIPSLGASGAISALLGYYLIRFPENRVKVLWTFYYVGRVGYANARTVLVSWILIQIVSSITSVSQIGGVAWFTHIGGFGFGVIFAFVMNSIRADTSTSCRDY